MKTKPNILLITSDQQRYDTVGDRAPSFMRTPHCDFLARDGITFTSAFAQTPACVPSRLSIMTGMETTSLGITYNDNSCNHINPSTVTLPRALRGLGYNTVAIGKMHFEPERARHGFDEMIIPRDYYNEMKASGSMYMPMRHGVGQNELYPTMATVPESMTLTSWISEKCVEYISERRDPQVPFFMWCSYSKPHPPLDPPEPYYSMYRSCDIPEPIYGDWCEFDSAPESFNRFRQSWSTDLIPLEIIHEARAAYYGLVTQIDYGVGRVLSALYDHNLYDNTLVIYTSDHGEFLGDHRCGAKFFFYEQSIHVPFIMRLPKTSENRYCGVKSDSLITHADIMPTIIAAAGGDIPTADGINLIQSVENSQREYLEGIHIGPDAEYLAITNGKWKYIYYIEDGMEQLFDMINDPFDQHNCAVQNKEQLTMLKNELLKRHNSRISKYVSNDNFIKTGRRNDTEAKRRSTAHPGFHTESLRHDIQH